MKLPGGIHLAYCTNVHRGENWAETFAALEKHVMPVRRRVAFDRLSEGRFDFRPPIAHIWTVGPVGVSRQARDFAGDPLPPDPAGGRARGRGAGFSPFRK